MQHFSVSLKLETFSNIHIIHQRREKYDEKKGKSKRENVVALTCGNKAPGLNDTFLRRFLTIEQFVRKYHILCVYLLQSKTLSSNFAVK